MFYDRFIALCNQKGVKPTPLVLSMGLSSSNVSQWKKGSTPRPAVLEKLAAYFDVSVGYLMTGEKEDPAPAESQSGITGKEWELIRFFRELPDDLQEDVLAQLRGVLERRGLLPKQS